MEYDTIFIRRFYEKGPDGKIKKPNVPPGWVLLYCFTHGDEVWGIIRKIESSQGREKEGKECGI